MTPAATSDVRELALAVFAANGRLVSAGNELVAHLGLTSAWWQVLAALRYAPGPLAVASIARNMGLTRQAVQRIVDWFCNGSIEEVLVGMVDNAMLDQRQLRSLADQVEKAKKARGVKKE